MPDNYAWLWMRARAACDTPPQIGFQPVVLLAGEIPATRPLRMKMNRTTIMLREDQLKGLRALRLKIGITMGEAIRRAVDKWIKHAKSKTNH